MTNHSDKYVEIEGRDLAYVSADGNFGQDNIILFRPTHLTDAQWRTVAELSDYNRLVYIKSVLDGADLSQFEEN